MKRILVASVAVIALSTPAMAMNDAHSSQKPQPAQSSAAERINPMTLGKNEVRQIQEKLKQDGFNPEEVDGLWGPDTARAMRNFQQKNDIQSNGHLTEETLAKLGVKTPVSNRHAQIENKLNGKTASYQPKSQKNASHAAQPTTTGSGAGMKEQNQNSGSSNSGESGSSK